MTLGADDEEEAEDGDEECSAAVGSNDCLSGEKRQNNPLKSPSRAGSNGDRAGPPLSPGPPDIPAPNHVLTENTRRNDGKVEREPKLFVTLHREIKTMAP